MDLSALPRQTVCVLDADPDLAADLPAEEFQEARRRSVAHQVEVEGQHWDPREIAATAGPGWLGLLVIDGLIVRRVSVAGRTACEIFGVGDIFRPWDEDGEYEPLAIEVDWLVLKTARIAVLDRNFALRMGRWPRLSAW